MDGLLQMRMPSLHLTALLWHCLAVAQQQMNSGAQINMLKKIMAESSHQTLMSPQTQLRIFRLSWELMPAMESLTTARHSCLLQH